MHLLHYNLFTGMGVIIILELITVSPRLLTFILLRITKFHVAILCFFAFHV